MNLIMNRFKTQEDGHDFFTTEICKEMIQKKYVTDDYLLELIVAAEIEINTESLTQARLSAYETMINYLKNTIEA